MTHPPNLIVIVARGLRSDALGDAHRWPVDTPSLQRLTDRGARLVATSACPADPGGLATLVTGLHARQHGLLSHSGRSGSPQDPGASVAGPSGGWLGALRARGYALHGVGCVGAVMPWLDHGVLVEDVERVAPSRCAYFDAMAGKGLAGELRRQREQRARRGVFDPYRLQLDPGDDIDSFICARAAEALNAMPSDHPWALLVVLSGPGNELPPPMMYGKVSDRGDLAAGFSPVDLKRMDVLLDPGYPRVELQRLDADLVRRIRADYLGRVGLCDHGIGWILARLERRQDRPRTWVTLTSDRGQLIGEHGVVGHQSFLSGAVEVPLIVAPPSPIAPAVHDALVSTVDVAATIAAIGGAELSAASLGRSLLPIFGEPGDSESLVAREVCISEFGERIMIETARHKAIFDVCDARPLALYDMLSKQEEARNIVDEPEGLNVLDSMRWRLVEALMPLRAQAVVGVGAG